LNQQKKNSTILKNITTEFMSNKKKSINERDQRIDAVLKKWKSAGIVVEAKKAEVKDWFENFEPSEQDDMVFILEKVEVW